MVGLSVTLTESWEVSAVGVALIANWEASPWVKTTSPVVPGLTAMLLAAPEVKFNAPAEVTARVPEVVVDNVRGPEVTPTVRPPVDGPTMLRAVVPEKVMLPASMVKLSACRASWTSTELPVVLRVSAPPEPVVN